MQRIVRRRRPDGSWFLREEGGGKREFRRVAGGLAWPARGRDGFLVVLGEDLFPDVVLGVRRLWVLAEMREHEGVGFMDPGALLRGAVHLRDLMAIERWGAPESPHGRELRALNRQLAAARAPRLRVTLPPDYTRDRVFEYYAALVRKRLAAEKTLHFGDSALPAALGNLPRDISGLGFDAGPEVAALFCAVAILDLTGGEAARTAPGGGPADGTAGY